MNHKKIIWAFIDGRGIGLEMDFFPKDGQKIGRWMGGGSGRGCGCPDAGGLAGGSGRGSG